MIGFEKSKGTKSHDSGIENEGNFEKDFSDIIVKKIEGDDNKKGHYDFLLLGGMRIDVKYRKDLYIWLEFRNIGEGNGWLFGKADYIGFYIELKKKWVFMERATLAFAAGMLTKDTTLYYEEEKALYGRYQRKRWGNKDRIMVIKLSDLNKFNILSEKKFLQRIKQDEKRLIRDNSQ